MLISRGELVQIGGGFRIPEILEASGAGLREVGTTNRTTLEDYRRALGAETALILKVHRSNFFMEGFVDAPPTAELAELAREGGVPLVEDLGSGALIDTQRVPGAEREPTPAAVLREGVDLVCFSGDKLLGGPQAGIVAGPGDVDRGAPARSALPRVALRQAGLRRAAGRGGVVSGGPRRRGSHGAGAAAANRGRAARPGRSARGRAPAGGDRRAPCAKSRRRSAAGTLPRYAAGLDGAGGEPPRRLARGARRAAARARGRP